jgi:hypothetical protein
MSKATELSTSKVVAGGMAAATSAVLGSQFGAFGTVGGAAVGSVVTTVGTSLYQRSLEHARSRVTARLPMQVGRGQQPPEGGIPPSATVRNTAADTVELTSAQGVAPGRAERAVPGRAGKAAPGRAGKAAPGRAGKAAPAERVPPRHWARALLIGTALVFCLGLALVTGIEWVKGSPLSGGSGGTSVGAVLEQSPAPKDTDGSTGTEDRDPDRDTGADSTDPTSSDRVPLPTAPRVPSAVPTPGPVLPLPVPTRLGGSDRSGE